MEKVSVNTFPVKLGADSISLAHLYGANQVEADKISKTQFSKARTQWISAGEGIRVLQVTGETALASVSSFASGEVGLALCKLLDHSFANHLRRSDLVVRFQRVGITSHERIPINKLGPISIHRGLHFRSLLVSGEKSEICLLAAPEVVVRFSERYDYEPTFLMGRSVIYKPNETTNVEDNYLRGKIWKYLGKVVRTYGDWADVSCQDLKTRKVKLTDIHPEPDPQNLYDFERQYLKKTAQQDLWLEIQKASFILTDRRRKNPSVLKDKMTQTIRMLRGSPNGTLELYSDTYSDFRFEISCDPIELEVKRYA